jgi:hypothetical protein
MSASITDRLLRLRPSRPAILARPVLMATVLTLSACAGPAPAPVVTAAPAPIETPRLKPRHVARARRPDIACAAVKIDLPQDRKEELFREFDATVVPAPAATVIPAPDCRQASR